MKKLACFSSDAMAGWLSIVLNSNACLRSKGRGDRLSTHDNCAPLAFCLERGVHRLSTKRQLMFPELDLHCTDPAQDIITEQQNM